MILDGKAVAKQNEQTLKIKVKHLLDLYGRVPCLKVILVGDSPASMAYVTSKKKACHRVGMNAEVIQLPVETTEQTLIDLIQEMNDEKEIDGILIQLPLPKHMNENKVLNTVSPNKDVDGLHTLNAGKLFTKQDGIIPATPLGIIMLLKAYNIDLFGKHAVIMGRSNLVGLPIGKLLLDLNATVTYVHRETVDPKKYTKDADLLVVAIGKANHVDQSFVKKGVCVIDVGINRVDGSLVGDVNFEEVSQVASYITPVPGGVGPMTISALLHNVIKQFEVKYDR